MKRFFLAFLISLVAGPALANDYFTASGTPATGASLSSATMRAEFALIEDGFDMLPTLSGGASLPVFIDSGETALEWVTAAAARTNLGLVIGTDVQAYDADLTTYWAEITPSANVQSFLGGANYSAMRTLLGVAIGSDVQAYDATILTESDVDDTSVNGATTDPISSNWAYNHENDAAAHGGGVTPPTGVSVVGGIAGLVLSNATDTDHDISISAGACLDSTGAYNILNSAAMVKAIDNPAGGGWTAETNGNGLLNGTVSANELYHVYALYKDADGTADFGFLDQDDAIGTYLPAGYTYYRWIGFVDTDASSNIRNFAHLPGDNIVFNSAFKILTNVTTASLTSQNISGFIPSGNVDTITVGGNDNAGGGMITFGNSSGEAIIQVLCTDGTDWARILDLNDTNPTIAEVYPTAGGAIYIYTNSVSTDIWLKAVKIIR